MLNLYKKIVVWLMLVVNLTVWTAPVAYANLTDTLKSLGASVTTQSSGRYSSSARNVQTMGGISMRFSTRGSSVTLVSITPPGYSVGCGGISAWFGGFSFVTGKQVEQWIRTIAQGATAFVVKMAIKALCPICEAVLATIEKLAQFAAKLSMDGCAAGQALASMAASSFGADSQDKKRSFCSKDVADWGKASDVLSGLDQFCNSINQANGWIDKAKARMFDKKDPAGDILNDQGNQTWLILRGMNLAGPEAGVSTSATDKAVSNMRGWHGYLLMNLVGAYTQGSGSNPAPCSAGGTATTSTDGSTDQSAPGNETGCYYAPKAHPNTIWAAMMCGNASKASMPSWMASQSASGAMAVNVTGKDASGKEVVGQKIVSMGSAVFSQLQDYCKGLSTDDPSGDGSLWVCDGAKESDATENDYFPLHCTTMKEQTWSEVRSKIIGDTADNGYLMYVYLLMLGGVQSVVNGTALDPALVAMLDRTSYPVYQLLTVAAVYPDAALSSIASLSLIIGQAMVTDEIRQLSNSMNKSGVLRTAKGSEISTRILTALKDLNDHNVNITKTINTESDTQTKMYAQIRELNRRMQQSVLGPNLLANEKLATTLTKRITKRDEANAPSNNTLTTTTP